LHLCAQHKMCAVLRAMGRPKIYLKTRAGGTEGQLWLCQSLGTGKRLEHYTGLRLERRHYNAGYWKSGTKRPVRGGHPFAEQYNALLLEMEQFAAGLSTVERVRDPAELKRRLSERFGAGEKGAGKKAPWADGDFIGYCEHVLSERESGIRAVGRGIGQGRAYRPNSLRNARSTIASLRAFAAHRGAGTLAFGDIGMDFYHAYRDWMLNVRGQKASTFSARVRIVKAFMNEGLEDGAHGSVAHRSRRFSAPGHETDAIALTAGEVAALAAADVPAGLLRVRDLFLAACYTGLRFSDFSRLEATDIAGGFVRLRQEKTGGQVAVPVMRGLAAVLERWGGSLPPPCSSQHFNRMVKKAVALPSVGIDREVRRDGAGRPVMLSALVSSHTGRRTYATCMFRAGVPAMLVMAATGHRTEAAFLRYIRAGAEEKSRMLAEWVQRLGL